MEKLPRQKKNSEATLQSKVMHYLRHEQSAYLCALTNTPHAADSGYPDITCVGPMGQYVAIELKAPNGKQSPAQNHWQKRIEARGGRYYVIHSIHELRACLI